MNVATTPAVGTFIQYHMPGSILATAGFWFYPLCLWVYCFYIAVGWALKLHNRRRICSSFPNLAVSNMGGYGYLS
jgi:hypothetical protein